MSRQRWRFAWRGGAAGRDRKVRHGSCQRGEAAGGFALHERFQPHADEGGFFYLAGIFACLCQQGVINIQRRSHAYIDASFRCLC